MELFGTAGIRGPVATRVTPELALAVGRAAAKDGEEFVVGRDGRTTGEGLAAAMAAGLVAGGATVRRIGVVPTPALAYASRGRHGVMLTASHNPPADNGIKLFADGVEYDASAERAVEERVEARVGERDEGGDEDRHEGGVEADPDPVPWDAWGTITDEAVLADYRAAVVAYARNHGTSLERLRVVVDCGNGMGARATPQVLRELGADVTAMNASVDGHFPARESKPTPETLADLRATMAEAHAADNPGVGYDLGLAHDGDADRIVVLAPDGSVVHEDTVVAILAAHYVGTADVTDPVVVTTPNASGRIDERVEAAGGRVERVRLGYLHDGIADARAAGGDVVFAAEPWKHIHTAFGGWIDGVTSAAVLARLVAEAGSVAALREPVTERPYRKESVPCPDDAKDDAMAAIADALPAALSPDSVSTDHGVRLTFPDSSWVLVRPSGTEPYVRIYAESDGVDELVVNARAVVENAVEGVNAR